MGAGAGGTWEKGADGARYVPPKKLAAAEQRVDALPSARRTAVEAALERLAGLPPGVAGVQQARDLYVATVPTLEDPANDADVDPAVSAFRAGSACVLAGLVARSGPVVAQGPSPDADAVALLTAVRGLSVIGEPEGSRLREELAVALPDALYRQALQSVK